MRPSILRILISSCILTGMFYSAPPMSLAQDPSLEFPYVAYVAKRSTSILSGPGFEYYSTARMTWGSKVEAYQHENKWVAIRPPEGSFSWIPSQHVEVTDNPAVVRVASADARSRIGTRFSTKRDVESVTMRRGELLEVLGKEEFADSKGELETWYKISPPPGEFRWLLASALSNTPPVKSLEKPSEPESPDSTEASITAVDEAPASAAEWRVTKGTTAADAGATAVIVAATYESPVREIDGEQANPTGTHIAYVSDAEQNSDRIHDVSSSDNRSSGITTIMPIESDTPKKTLDPVAQNATTNAAFHRAIVNDPTIRDGAPNGQIEQIQWSYDLAPRTSSDTFSRQQRRLPGSAWREVSRFSEIRQVANATLLPDSLPVARTASNHQAPPLTSAKTPVEISATSPVSSTPIPPCGPARSHLWLMQQELMDIELRLAQAVTQPPAAWSLSMLRARTQAMIDSSQIATIRDESQKTLAKIAQFEDVQRRSRNVDNASMSVQSRMPSGGVLPTAAAAGSWLANVPMGVEGSGMYDSYAGYRPASTTGGYPSDGYVPGPGETIIADRRADEPAPDFENSRSEPQLAARSSRPEATSASEDKYDGTGWLMPVVTDRNNMPRYVLTDASGNVKHFVTPQPGLNLKRYLRQKIAIYGQSRFIDDLQRPHLTAERIISLDKKVR